MTHSFFIMNWRVAFVINVLSNPIITSLSTEANVPGLIDLGQYPESIDNPDLDPVDLNSVSTELKPDFLAGVASNTIDINNDLTTASSDCSFDSIESTNQLQRRQISFSSLGCSHAPQIEPLRHEETEANPSTLISSAQTGHEDPSSNSQASNTHDATSSVLQMEGGGSEGIGGGDIPLPEVESPGSEALLGIPVKGMDNSPANPNQPANSNQDLSFPQLNNVVRFRFEHCPFGKFKHRQITACDGGKDEYIIKGVVDYELLNVRVPAIGTYL